MSRSGDFKLKNHAGFDEPMAAAMIICAPYRRLQKKHWGGESGSIQCKEKNMKGPFGSRIIRNTPRLSPASQSDVPVGCSGCIVRVGLETSLWVGILVTLRGLVVS